MQIHRKHVYKGCVLSTTIKMERGVKGAVLDSMVKESLSVEVIFVEEVGELAPWVSRGRVLQAEGTAHAKALRQDCA